MFGLMQSFQEPCIIIRRARWHSCGWGRGSRNGSRDRSNGSRCLFGLLLFFLGLFLRLGRGLWLRVFGLPQGLKGFGLIIVRGWLGLGIGSYTDGDATSQYGEFSISHNYFLE
jgi:hypothetical protein